MNLNESFDRTASHMADEYVAHNEPVAWINRKGEFMPEKVDSFDIPLYTHPADLTDEEIEEFAYAFQLWQLHNPDKALEGIMDFARAILRKAKEK